jgi:hypothetical protein
LRVALARHLVTDVDAPANYSLQIEPPPAAGEPASFHFLHRSSTSVVRSRDTRRIARALVGHLSSHHPAHAAGLLRLQGVTLVRDGAAVLAPAVLRQWPELIERRLNGRGLRFVDLPWAVVDPDRAEVVVPEPALDVDWTALDALALLGDRADPAVEPGRYPLAGWAFWVGPDDVGPLSRAQAVLRGVQLLLDAIATDDGRERVQRVLDDLASLVRSIDAAGIGSDDPIALVDPLAALAS